MSDYKITIIKLIGLFFILEGSIDYLLVLSASTNELIFSRCLFPSTSELFKTIVAKGILPETFSIEANILLEPLPPSVQKKATFLN